MIKSQLAFSKYSVRTTWHGFVPSNTYSALHRALRNKDQKVAEYMVMESFLSMTTTIAAKCEFARFLHILNTAVLSLLLPRPVMTQVSDLLFPLLTMGQNCPCHITVLSDLMQLVSVVTQAPSFPIMEPLCLLFHLPQETHSIDLDWATMEKTALTRCSALKPLMEARDRLLPPPQMLSWDEDWPITVAVYLWTDRYYESEHWSEIDTNVLRPWLLCIISDLATRQKQQQQQQQPCYEHHHTLILARLILKYPAMHRDRAAKARVQLLWWCCKIGFAMSKDRPDQYLLEALHQNWVLTNSLLSLYHALAGSLWWEKEEQDKKRKQMLSEQEIRDQLEVFIQTDLSSTVLESKEESSSQGNNNNLFEDLERAMPKVEVSRRRRRETTVFKSRRKRPRIDVPVLTHQELEWLPHGGLSVPRVVLAPALNLFLKGPFGKRDMDQELRFYRIWTLLQVEGNESRPFSFHVKHYSDDGMGDMALTAKLDATHLWGRDIPTELLSMPAVAMQVLVLLISRLACGQRHAGRLDELLFECHLDSGVFVFPQMGDFNAALDKSSESLLHAFCLGLTWIIRVDPDFFCHVGQMVRMVKSVQTEDALRVDVLFQWLRERLL